jgi:hypothetical protein
MIVGVIVLFFAVFDSTNDNRGRLALLGLSLLAIAAWIVRARIAHWMAGDRMARHEITIGTILLVLGTGFIVFNLPDVLRYVLVAGYMDLSSGQDLALALGAMMLASGWFLRRPSPRT